jgi:hypothetical protein
VQKELGDVIRVALNKPPKIKEAGSSSLILLPIIGSNPATGFMVGVGGQYAFRMPGSTLYSSLAGSVQFTTKNQQIFLLKNNIYTKNNRFFLSGDWRYMIYSQSTYGRGTNFSYYEVEWRSFHGLSKSNPRHLVAFWLLGNFSASGDLPYLILPATSYDQRSRSGRGYTQGRFRGANMVYGEAEYRFPISKCGGVLGGVLFVNATSADAKEKSLALFESVKPGYGMGLRIMADKSSRTNLAVDIGFGQRSFGFYFAASESF